jgi:hypothetical protein
MASQTAISSLETAGRSAIRLLPIFPMRASVLPVYKTID